MSHRSKSLASALAIVLGTFGVHRLYLRGAYWWVYPLVTMPLVGWALRATTWYRHPGFFLWSLVAVVTMIEAIRIGLTPDARWDARHNPHSGRASSSGWASVLMAIAGLVLAAMLSMSVMAIALEGFFNARLGR